MPNNKKNRKNKEKKASAAAAAAAAAATTPPSSSTTTTAAESPLLRPCPHNDPACCDICLSAYPPGCLHTLREEERNSPEMNECLRVLMDGAASAMGGWNPGTSLFWKQLENIRFLAANDDRMVRLCVHEAIKVIVGKESFFPQQEGEEEEQRHMLALVFIHHMLLAYRIHILKCEALLCVNETEFYAKDLVSFEELYAVINELHQNSYHRMVYTLNELSPCNCLKEWVESSRQEAEQQHEQQQQAAEEGRSSSSSLSSCLMHCFNPGCTMKESSPSDNNQLFSVCAGCKIVHYCSRRCYKDHWRGDNTIMTTTTGGGGSPPDHAPPRPHKIACQAIQELKSFLAGGRCGGGDDDDRSAMGRRDDSA